MRTPKNEQPDLLEESDEVLLEMMEELKLELKDIKVSDELISKTLKRISEQEASDVQKAPSNVVSMESMKASPKYRQRNYKWIKSVSVAAAACLVLFLGMNAMKSISLFGGKSEKSTPYEMKSADSAENAAYIYEDATMKSSETQAPQVEQDAVLSESENYNYSVAGADLEKGDSSEGTITDSTSPSIAYSKALENAMNTTDDVSKIYEYTDLSTSDQAVSLLSLFTSDELSVSSGVPSDEWTHYMVFSLGEEDAVIYQVGETFVIAKNYHNEDKTSQVTYEMKDPKRFQELLLESMK